MKKQHKKLLLILPLLPLMMANSPARSYVEQPNYDDFEIELVSKEATGRSYYGGEYHYTFHLKNTGEGYIYNLVYSDNAFEYDYWAIPYMAELDTIFDNVVLAPHHEYTFSFYDRDIYFENYKISSFAYTDFLSDEEIGGPKTTSIIHESSYSTDIYAEYKILNENQYKYFYMAIITVNYDGVDYSVPTGGRYYYDDREGFVISSKGCLDYSKLVIPENNCVIVRQLQGGYVEPTFNVTAMLIALGVGVGGAAIFCAIYFPIKARKKKENE